MAWTLYHGPDPGARGFPMDRFPAAPGSHLADMLRLWSAGLTGAFSPKPRGPVTGFVGGRLPRQAATMSDRIRVTRAGSSRRYQVETITEWLTDEARAHRESPEVVRRAFYTMVVEP